MNESLTFAKHIYNIDYNDIPSNVVTVTKKSFLDGLGVILGASGLGEGCQYFVDIAVESGGKEESTIIGTDIKVPSYMAAFANGSMSHALDYEDLGGPGHPNAAQIPAALAVAESMGNVNGKRFITALALGCDMVCRLAMASRDGNEEPLQHGWYIPPIYGTFGAITAVGKLLDLTPEQLVDSFSLGMCQCTCSAELIYSPNGLVRAIRDAFAAKAGVLSGLLAQKGVTGFEHPIEGKAGFYTMYSRNGFDSEVLTSSLGEIFEGVNVSFKPWPSCGGTYPYIQATLQMAEDYDLKTSDIDEIKFILHSPNTMLCEPLENKRKPTTNIDAKFSIPYCIALALVHKKVTLEYFTENERQNPNVLEITKKITYKIDNTGIPTAPDDIAIPEGLVQIKTKDNEIISKEAKYLYGHPENPISQEELIAKFKNCATYSAKKITEDNLNKIVQLVLHLEDVKDVGELVKFL